MDMLRTLAAILAASTASVVEPTTVVSTASAVEPPTAGWGEAPANHLVPLQVLVQGADGKPLRPSRRVLNVEVEVRDELGWPQQVYPSHDPALAKGPAWHGYLVPRGAEVRLAAFLPPHPVVERTIRIESAGEPRPIRLVLGEAVPKGSVRIRVELPENMPEWSDGFMVMLCAPNTGIPLVHSTIAEARRGLEAPCGTYLTRLEGQLPGYCGNGRPEAQDLVPARAEVRSSEEASEVTLRVERGSRLQLRVVHPDPPATAGRMAPLEGRGDGGDLVVGQRFTGSSEDLVRARLVSRDGWREIDLTWGWAELAYAIPWDHFPMDQDVYQIVPVPCGEYELVIRGRGIEETRRPLILGPEAVTVLQIRPRKAGGGD